MFIRRSFDEFLKLSSDVAASPGRDRDWVIDWRWLSAPDNEGISFPSERSLIDCSAWVKPKTQKPA